METIYWLLVLLGLVFFVLAMLGVRQPKYLGYVAAGLACWIAVEFIVRTKALFNI